MKQTKIPHPIGLERGVVIPSPRWSFIPVERDPGHMKIGREYLEWALRFIPFVTWRNWTTRAESGGPHDLRDRTAVH